MPQRFFPPFSVGANVSNQAITDAFRCKNIGGIRYSTATKTIVLILNYNFGIYDNSSNADDGEFYFAGEGQEGDQCMNRGNLRLNNAAADGIELHLFESLVNEPGYRYRGTVETVGEPRIERQTDRNGNERDVFMFKLRRCKQ